MSEHSGNNGDGAKLIVKAELINKNINITFGHEVPPLIYDRAVHLINSQFMAMLRETNQTEMSKPKTPPPSPIITDIQGLLKGKRI